MDTCIFCKKAKNLLEERANKDRTHISVKAIPGVGNPEVDKIMASVGRSDFRSWPKIFLNGDFIGGYGDLENKLKHMH